MLEPLLALKVLKSGSDEKEKISEYSLESI
jgi:hypothetical protein